MNKNPPPSGAFSYRPDIDGMRAIAIGLVCIFHFHLFPIGDAGFIGVDVFFVLSGFLITRILINSLATETFSLGQFYFARLRRLMPALVATLVLYLIAGAFIFLPDRFAELSIEVMLSQFYLVNIYFWRTINYFGLQADNVPLLHMWSLAIEEQFYVFYPLAVALVYKFARQAIFLIAVITFILSFALGVFATGWKPEASFYLLPTRAWELMAGGILALRIPQGSVANRFSAFAGPLGLGIIALALITHAPTTPFPGWFAALPVAGAILLLMGAPNTPIGRMLSWAPMVWLGKISYPLYLVHWPIIILTRASVDVVTPIWQWTGFLFSIALAWAIWAFVERPIRSRRIFAMPKHLVLGAFATTIGLSAIGVIGWQTQGLPNRFSPEVRTLLAYADDLPRAYWDCELAPYADPIAGCPLGVANQTPDVIVIGDSHAQALAGAVDLWLKQQHRAGVLYFHHGCIPLLEVRDLDCGTFVDTALSKLQTTPSVRNVVLISAWRHNPSVFNGRFLKGEDADRAFRAALTRTLEHFHTQGIQVTLVDPMFYASNRVPQTMARNLHFGRNWEVDKNLKQHEAENAVVHAAFAAESTALTVERVSLIRDLCQGGICRAVKDGAPIYTDGNHVRFGMSDYFAQQLSQIKLQ